ncbi:hypothetical protein ACJRO7_006811 [Eucalyptus globulus]|uniref:F-box domain-containing protein n=1 Tax=Eucalyptus globulus TaxID=34317 RepID=A0ABD3IMK2_EUCGL
MADGEGETEAGAVLHGDVLALTLSYVPLVDLVSASRVSRSWRDAVFFCLRHLRWRRPWLLIYCQSIPPPHTVSVRAYDPRSRVWMDLEEGPYGLSAILRAWPLLLLSSHSALLYRRRLSFSSDPLHLTWHHASSPSVDRSYPVAAFVGSRLVVAGGTYENDSPPVEVYNTRTRTWSAYYSMPASLASLRVPTASFWHSVATDGQRMYIMQTLTGATHTFDPDTGAWLQPYDLRPDRDVFYSLMGFAGDRLVVGVKVWGSMGVGADRADELEEICAIPRSCWKNCKTCKTTFTMFRTWACAPDFLYLHSQSSPHLVFWCGREDNSGAWRWGTTRDPRGRNFRNWVVYTCAEVGMGELREAAVTGHGRFVVTTAEGR